MGDSTDKSTTWDRPEHVDMSAQYHNNIFSGKVHSICYEIIFEYFVVNEQEYTNPPALFPLSQSLLDYISQKQTKMNVLRMFLFSVLQSS